jgi:hypothetical protein
MPFKRGKSGNPSGRPKATEAQLKARELKQKAQPEAVKVLSAIMRSKKERAADRIAAAKALLDGLDALKIEADVTTHNDGPIAHEKLKALLMAKLKGP